MGNHQHPQSGGGGKVTPPKRKNPTSGQTGGASTYQRFIETHFNISPEWFQHVNGVKVVIVRRIRSTPTTKPCYDRAQHWRGWLYRAGVL